MKIKEGFEEEYQEYKNNNADPYGGAVISYSERWATAMEQEMAKGVPIEECADRLSFKVNTSGITGFMYGCAVSSLARYWEHGEALRRWHNLNTQINNEGEVANESGGVLNPALLNISID